MTAASQLDTTQIDLIGHQWWWEVRYHNPDFTTARRVTDAINSFLGGSVASTVDPSTVRVSIPASSRGNMVSLLTDIEQLRVEPDLPAKVVIDEASGIVVMGSDVRISAVAIAQGNLTIRVTEMPDVSQPEPFSNGETTNLPRTDIRQLYQTGSYLKQFPEAPWLVSAGPQVTAYRTWDTDGKLQDWSLRTGATLVWAQGSWGAKLGLDRVARQGRVPVGELATPGYTLWNAAVSWRMKAPGATLLWYARLDNAGNKLAYSATSILTQTAPGKAPLPGRSLKLGVQATF